MVHKTKGIVLRQVKYGDTSLVVTCLTEMFGLQSYLVSGVRTISKNGASKAGFFQPAAMLDLVAYHNELKNLQRLKEYRWDYLYRNIFSDVPRHAVSLFMIELLTKCLKQPEAHAELFYFAEESLQTLDMASEKTVANFPLFFALHLPVFFGFRISNSIIAGPQFLDLQEGGFTSQQPAHSFYLEEAEALVVSHILKATRAADLESLSLPRELKRKMLQAVESYYALHVPDFGHLRSLPVLKEIMS